MSALTYMFCGGGSGGHLYPGIAVAEELRSREPDCRIVFVGSMRDVEKTVLAKTNFEHVPLDVLPGSMLFRSPVRFLRTHRAAVRRSLELIGEYQPVAVIGLGGFASVPVVTAASRMRRPEKGTGTLGLDNSEVSEPSAGASPLFQPKVVLLEQNRVPGRATSWLSRRADVVCLSFPETVVRCERVVLTGNPVRNSVVAVRESEPGNTLLMLGGSQGAVGLNSLVMSMLDEPSRLPTGWRVVHQTGAKDEDRVRSHYESAGIHAEVHSFIANMPAAYAESGLVITRAGGTTLAELSCVGRAAVLVPIPKSVRDHQRLNAECFAESKAACVIEQNSAIEEARRVVSDLVFSPDQCDDFARAMKLLGYPDAAQNVADTIDSLL